MSPNTEQGQGNSGEVLFGLAEAMAHMALRVALLAEWAWQSLSYCCIVSLSHIHKL